jgi:hypothetical protein
MADTAANASADSMMGSTVTDSTAANSTAADFTVAGSMVADSMVVVTINPRISTLPRLCACGTLVELIRAFDCRRLSVHKSVPAVRIHLAPPMSPRFLRIPENCLNCPCVRRFDAERSMPSNAPSLATVTWTNLSRVQKIGPASEPRWRNSSSPGSSA